MLVVVSLGVGLVARLTNELVEEVADAIGIGGGAAETAIALGFPFLLWVATAWLLYRLVPATGRRTLDALVGAIVAAILLLVSRSPPASCSRSRTDWSLIYGSLTSLLVFLYSVYLYAAVLLFGAAVAAEWSQPHVRPDAPPLPLGRRLRSGVRGLFVR